jgi:hypothetical protein
MKNNLQGYAETAEGYPIMTLVAGIAPSLQRQYAQD